MKNFTTVLAIASLMAIASSAHAGAHGGAPKDVADVKKEMPISATVDMAEGEIRKVDVDNKKITIKHGVIKNLDMPGMTMVFQVKDPALLSGVKQGEKIRFKAEKLNGAIVVTDIQSAK
ncbi:MAG: copper-binding protein [Candidatus Saccharibacteria bacterium]|nr:copper-binding protein [Rhodoferax sp.]